MSDQSRDGADTEPASTPEPASTDGERYQSGMTAGAVLLTVFAPFIALVAALIMLGSERSPVRRAFLRTWAWWSGGVLVVGTIIAISLFAAIASGTNTDEKGPCVGGPKLGAPGVQVGPHRYRFPCEISGSTVVRLP